MAANFGGNGFAFKDSLLTENEVGWDQQLKQHILIGVFLPTLLVHGSLFDLVAE